MWVVSSSVSDVVTEVTGETLVTRTCVLEDMNSQCGLFKFQVGRWVEGEGELMICL